MKTSRILILALAALLMVSAVWAQNPTGNLSGRVTADGATWFGHRGPPCPLGSCLGPLACPGCGLLRSTAAALEGEFGLAWRCHPTGPVVAALLVLGLLLHFDILRRRCEMPAHRRWRHRGQRLFVVALLLGWSLRLLRS